MRFRDGQEANAEVQRLRSWEPAATVTVSRFGQFLKAEASILRTDAGISMCVIGLPAKAAAEVAAGNAAGGAAGGASGESEHDAARALTIFDLAKNPALASPRRICTSPVCYSCAAGSGSSCGGSLMEKVVFREQA